MNRQQKNVLIEIAQLTEQEAQEVFDLCKKEELFKK